MGHKSFSLKASVLTKDLELGNALSEKVVPQYEEASGDQFPPENQTMNLTDMCPQVLQHRIKDFGAARLSASTRMKPSGSRSKIG